jgi:hypothetical protein
MTQTIETRILCTTRNLTGAELCRLLTRGKISPAVAELIWQEEAEEADYMSEIAGERLAETGHAVRYQTRLEAYFTANPLYTCLTAEQAGFAGLGIDDDEVPF